MKRITKIFVIILAFSLVISSLFVLSSCKRGNDNTGDGTSDTGETPDNGNNVDGAQMSVSINGDEHISLLFGETITLFATVVPENLSCGWNVIEEKLGGDYTFEGGRFTAGNTAGYVVIKASLSDNTYDLVTIVINKNDSSTLNKVIFYAVDGKSIVDIKYVEENGHVSAPAYAVSEGQVVWLYENGQQTDPASVAITKDTYFIARSTANSVYYTITYWYEDASGEARKVGDSFYIDFANGETVPTDVLYNIETEIESLTEKNVVNWRCEISTDKLTVDWYAELN